MFSQHHETKDPKDPKDHKHRNNFFGLTLKKIKDSRSSSSSLHEKQTTDHVGAPRANSTGSTSSNASTEVSDLEHHHNHNHSHNHSNNHIHNQDHHDTHKNNINNHNNDTSNNSNNIHKEEHGHSMLELKRFFKPSNFKLSSSHSSLRNGSSTSIAQINNRDPFNEDGVLFRKYGNMGKILGSGAGGSVRLLTRPSDGLTFAVKEFRARRPNEEMKEYVRKCTSEFSIGSTLHHPNVIKTLDIAHFGDHYYEVMEYCPIDFFAVVMSGKMNRGEINCCFRQMVEGVKYLHSMGLAHRDLKLDNCVITKDGILKLIDFGSAVVFRYPYEDGIVKARGIVGSDPYMAPEVYSPNKYDPQPVDIWSLAIIYCCMTIKRFPWKVPKQTDKSFKLYCLPDDRPHDYYAAAKIHRELQVKRREEKLRRESQPTISQEDGSVESVTKQIESTNINEQPQEQQQPSKERQDSVTASISEDVKPSQSKISQYPNDSTKNISETIKRIEQRPRQDNHTVHGPYRLMRLLPHAARPIISRMLKVDPEHRATMVDIFNDEWFKEIKFCTEDSNSKPLNAPGHRHTSVSEDKAHLESYKDHDKQKQ